MRTVTEDQSDLFRQIADRIEDNPNRYDQREWRTQVDHPCKTAYCIGGHALAIRGLFEESLLGLNSPRPMPAGLLGLDEDEDEVLFAMSWGPREGLSVPDALRCLAEGAEISEVSA